jgi:hypothetical protein
MQRKFGRAIAAMVVVALGVCLMSSTARSDDDKKPAAGGGGMDMSKMTPEQQQQMMQQYMAMSKPGPEHEKLKEMVGDWNAEAKFLNPDGSPMGGGKGTMHITPMLDGRFYQMKFDGENSMMGQAMPFHGIGIVGYDKGKKKYTSVWMDDMGTGMMITEGTCDGSVITSEGTMCDPMTGQNCKVKEVATHTDKDHMKYEMWGTEPGQDKMVKMMEINYTRKS